MERHIMFMNWKTRHSKDANAPLIDLRFNTIPIKIPAKLFVDLDELILKFIWKGAGPRQRRILTKKNKVGKITIPDIKVYYITTVIKTVWHWQRDRHRPMEQNREHGKKPTQICSNDFFQRCKSNSVEERYPFQQMVLE